MSKYLSKEQKLSSHTCALEDSKEGRGKYLRHPRCDACTEEVRKYFEKRKIKPREIQEKTGLSKSTVKRIFACGSDPVSLSTIYYISEAYGVSPAYFICDSPTDYQQSFLENMAWLTHDASPQSLDRITQIVKLVVEEQAQK